eukprot:CAMPEP_0185723094 /NCGR_PEP_ID=MMETSP1171-20130828/39_1 /TAXON_ID=374046 /ORGANISM="Helicotheca tamensis, Strain CCMP826" /LENGTH=232 /DNA_ID=CAMNT_0028390757 /DNA_START=51 /DNA_END=749 /DNA_ORIENTATION=+
MVSAVLFATTLFAILSTFASAGSNEPSLAWLAENKEKEGVKTLPSGLQYKVLKKGDGAFHPTVDSPCNCHYEGKLIDGTVFDSSYARGSPTSFAPNQVIKGWTEIMQLMVEGDKFEVYIPSELGYGDSGSPPKIGPGDALIFTMEILEIQGGKVPAITCNVVTLENCNEKETAYVKKAKAKYLDDVDDMQVEIERLNGLQKSSTTASLKAWMGHRVILLERLVEANGGDDEF